MYSCPETTWPNGVTLWKPLLLMPTPAPAPTVPRLTYLRIKNYRALRDVEFRDLTPLTVLIGPNGSGKSTVLDALDFLAEAVSGNMVQAWATRNRFAGMRTRGTKGGILFELEAKLSLHGARFRYYLEIDEVDGHVIVKKEWLKAIEKQRKKHSDDIITDVFSVVGAFNKTHNAVRVRYQNQFIADKGVEYWETKDEGGIGILKYEPMLSATKILKVSFGALTTVLRKMVEGYRYIHLTDDHLKGYSDAGPREKLSPNGDNLPNVLYYLYTKHRETLAKITGQMQRWVPGLADIAPEITSDERILLRFRDAPFEKPLPAQYMSAGTMRLAALLTLLYEPDAAGLLGMEEPENELHPQLLAYLAEELITATDTRQLLVATHSPALLNALQPEQVWILHRGADGYTQATRTADLPGIPAMVEEGTPLGYLWSRNFFDVGNPSICPPRFNNADPGRFSGRGDFS